MTITSERIKQSRKDVPLTMDELAEKMEVAQSAVVRWENGTTTPKIEKIEKLADILEVDSGYLLGTQNLKRMSSQVSLDETLSTIWTTFCQRKGITDIEKEKVTQVFASICQYNHIDLDSDLFQKSYDINMILTGNNSFSLRK